MKTSMRFGLSVAIVLLCLALNGAFRAAQGPIQGGIAVKQLNGGDVAYTTARVAATTSAIPTGINILGILVVVGLWVPVVRRSMRNDQNNQ